MKQKTIYSGIAVLVAILLLAVMRLFPFDATRTNDLGATVEPTTAILKSIDGDPPYLRLEQVRPEVIARFLLICMEGRIYMYAGIVTSPEKSVSIFRKATANFLEIDAEEVLRGKGVDGAEVAESTIWIFRPLDARQTSALKSASTLGAWTEDGGDFRWGAFMEVEGVRPEIVKYLERCR